MRHWCVAYSLADVVDVRAQCGPYTQEHRQRSNDSCSKHDCNYLGRRFGVIAEDMVNLGLGRVSERCLGDGERYIGVAGDLQVKDLALVWRR